MPSPTRTTGLLVALLLHLGPGTDAARCQVSVEAVRAALAHLDGGTRWNLDAVPGSLLDPPAAARDDALELASRGRGPRFHVVGLEEIAPPLALRARLEEPDGGRLLVVIASDLRRNRGIAIDFGAALDRRVTVFRLGPEGATAVAEAPRGRALVRGGRLGVTWDGRRLGVELVGLALFGERGLVLEDVPGAGRLQLAVQGGSLLLEGLALQARAPARSRRLLEARAGAVPLALPPVPALPLGSPYLLPAAGSLADGLPPEAAAELLALRGLAAGGRGLAVIPRVEALAAAHEHRGISWLLGALQLIERHDAAEAARWLRRAGDAPHALPLRVEARLRSGDLDGLEASISRIEPPHDAEALRWLLGRARGARREPGFTEAPGPACRRCAERRRRVLALHALLGSEALARAGARGLRVHSDAGGPRARRLLEEVRRFLAARPLGPEGQDAAEDVLDVVAFAIPEHLERWNGLFGGAGRHPVSGVYHPGFGLAVILDDVDHATAAVRLRHELVHHLLHRRGWSDLDPAAEEGLAEVLARGAALGDRWSAARTAADAAHLATCFEALEAGGLPLGRGADELALEDYAAAWAAMRFERHRGGPAWAAPRAGGGVAAPRGTRRASDPDAVAAWLRALPGRPLGWTGR